MKHIVKFILFIIFVTYILACAYGSVRSIQYLDEYVQATTKN